MLPLTLVGAQSVAVAGLLDTGAAVNVLPYAVGVQLGFYALRVAQQIRVQGPSEAANASTPPGRTGRRPGLHSGAATTRDDFDAPLPEDG